jgi:hypothetical protein
MAKFDKINSYEFFKSWSNSKSKVVYLIITVIILIAPQNLALVGFCLHKLS